jgi:hypothetical protein
LRDIIKPPLHQPLRVYFKSTSGESSDIPQTTVSHKKKIEQLQLKNLSLPLAFFFMFLSHCKDDARLKLEIVKNLITLHRERVEMKYSNYTII